MGGKGVSSSFLENQSSDDIEQNVDKIQKFEM